VRTDPAIRSVVAVFPFGLTKPLRHLADEDVPDRQGRHGTEGGLLWETRFLAPADMSDGTYKVRLILRDAGGSVYREEKSFVIASTPPTVRVVLPQRPLHRGESVPLRVAASSSTRTLTARLENGVPVNLRWNSSAGANTGTLTIPADLPFGAVKLTVTAEDVAHNLGTAEVTIHVSP
jgi:Ca-activated chloride channel homolog